MGVPSNGKNNMRFLNYMIISMYFLVISTNLYADNKLSDLLLASMNRQLNISNLYAEGINKGYLSDGNEYLTVTFTRADDSEYNEKMRNEDKLYRERCAVFRLIKNQPKLMYKSLPVENGGDRSNIDCAIKNKSVLILRDNWSGGSHSSNVYKYNLHNNQLLLSGIDNYSVYSGRSDETSDENYFESIDIYNLNTDTLIRSIKKGGNTREYETGNLPILPFRLVKPYRYKEMKFSFKAIPKTNFTNFDEVWFWEQIHKQKNICGYVNEDFKFETCKEFEEKYK